MTNFEKKLKKFSDKIQGLKTDLDFIVLETFKENETHLEAVNTLQLFTGVKADGSKLKPDYKESTKKIKAKKGQPFNRVTLNDTGNLYSTLNYKADLKGITVKTDTEYDKYLVKKYGVFLGLTPENKRKFIKDIFKPSILKKVSNYIFK